MFDPLLLLDASKMDQSIIALGFTSFLLLVFSVSGLLMRYQSTGNLLLADWFVVGLAGYSGVVMLLFVAASVALGDSKAIKMISESAVAWAYPIFTGMIIVGVWVATWLFGKTSNWVRVPDSATSRKLSARINWMAWATLLVGCGSYWLYARSYGGFSNLLEYSAGIRAGLVDVNDNAYTFLKRFGGFCFFSTLLFGGVILTKGKGVLGLLVSWLGFLMAFMSSLFILYSWEGRLGIVAFVLVAPFGYMVYRHGRRLILLRNAMLLSILPLVALPATSAIWGKAAESDNLSGFFVRELSFPLNSFSSAYENESLRYMQDVFAAPLYLFPTRVWKGVFGLDTASDVNTENVMGKRKGERGSTTAVPIDFVTFSFMQASFIGLLLVGFLFGALLCKLDNILAVYFYGGVQAMLYSYAVLFVAGMSALYADPKHILNRNFHFIIGIACLLWLCKSIKLDSLINSKGGSTNMINDSVGKSRFKFV